MSTPPATNVTPITPPPVPASAALLSNPREFIRRWLDINNIAVRADATLDHAVPKHKLFLTIWLDYEQARRAFNSTQEPRMRIQGAGKETLSDALEELIYLERTAKIAELAASVACTGEDLTELRKFTEAITGRADALDVAALAHFVWLVKRKLAGLPVTWHLMPILNGIQGVGKSTAIKELLKPVAVVTSYLKLDELADSRCSQALETKYVIVCDEMQGAARTEIETLKNRITAETVGMRPMRSNDLVDVRVNATFIGSTNKDVATLIKDSTGMRRFLEIRCKATLMREIYSVDFMKLWRGIDETRSKTYLEDYRAELAQAQLQIETPDEIAVFLNEFGLIPTGNSYGKIRSTKLYGDYKVWAAQHGHYAVNAIHFGRRLKSLGIESSVTTIAGCSVRNYHVTASGIAALKNDAATRGEQ